MGMLLPSGFLQPAGFVGRLLLITIGLASAAGASTITVYNVGFGRNGVSMLLNGSTTPAAEYATEILITKGGTNYIAYCLDLFTGIGLDTYDTTTGLPNSYPNGLRAAWLFENYFQLTTYAEQAVALQVAIWDVIHDGGDGLTSGNIQLDPTLEAALLPLANALVLASFGQSSMNATILYNTVISNGAPAQTLITSADAFDTPEPGTVALTAAGLASLWAFRRRIRS